MVSKKVIAAVVVVVVVIVAAVAVIELYHPQKIYHPTVFTDVSQTAAPSEGLDPATGFFTTDEPLFTALYQQLVEYNVTSFNVVPVIAQSVTYNVSNPMVYNFTLRPYVTFSNGMPVNATDVWFSIYRGILMAQAPYASDFGNILFNDTIFADYSIEIPWGIGHALRAAGYTINGKNESQNVTIEANDLAYILSHFKLNYTDWKVMTYPDQAVYLPASEINSTDPLNVTIQTMYPYPFLLQDIASSYGAIIEPQYVDAHGGVNVSGENSYINQNGALATGPYVISSVSSGYSTIVIVKNPHYWVDGHTVNNDTIVTVNSKTHMETISTPVNDVPYVASPPSIPEIVIEYGLSHADRIADFDTNLSQISTVGPTGFKQIINGYFNPSDRNTNLVQVIPEAGALYISLNVQRFPTNNTNFRAALYYAMNYSAQLALYDNNYNGSPLAYMELGPISPSYGLYYDPVHAPLPQQNLTLAMQYLKKALYQMHAYVVLPNGTKIGNTSGTDLSSQTFDITGISPPSTLESDQITIAIDSFKLLGLNFQAKYDTEGTVLSWTSPASTPRFVDLGWVPDYPDPVGQQLMAIYDVTEGGAFGGNDAWVNNTTLQNLFVNMDFEPESVQLKQMYEVYNITDHLYAYVWMPMSDNVFFIQPYIHNFYFNQFTGYFYNLLTSQYSFKETASPSSAVTSSSTASVLATTSLLASDALRMVS